MSVTPAVVAAFDCLKLAEDGPAFLHLVIKGKIVEVERAGEHAQSFGDFVQSLPEDHCVWGIATFQYQVASGGLRSKVIFVHWVPKASTARDRMQATFFTNGVKTSLHGLHVTLEARSKADLSALAVLEHASKFEREGVVEVVDFEARGARLAVQ